MSISLGHLVGTPVCALTSEGIPRQSTLLLLVLLLLLFLFLIVVKKKKKHVKFAPNHF